MPKAVKSQDLDMRGFALGLWPEGGDRGVDETRLTPGPRRHVLAMQEAGWLERDDGKLRLNEKGREAVAALLPETLPKLTDAQHDLLLDVVEGRSAGSDLAYPPVIKLLAYGLATARAQRFAGITLKPTDRAREWYASLVPDPVEDAPGQSPRAP
ncbi:hypothetical protein BHAOGJBA_5183 [Methylobacterium hispanicum]|uniref:MarR family transcriptional regulator n=1 Tax=Methylobacterium hispanicum TaxID=270350 RepID=A0AAV4ZVR9_9HYPH|nr:hypothetical protein [Methylobacterium hispanicum]GJD91635.1 hypothetical protein BHAOGJBA_5183 [Methylobacterium hispanicum]